MSSILYSYLVKGQQEGTVSKDLTTQQIMNIIMHTSAYTEDFDGPDLITQDPVQSHKPASKRRRFK